MEWIWGIGIAVVIAGFVLFMRWKNTNPFWHKDTTTRALELIKGTPALTRDGVKMYYEPKVEQVSHPSVDAGIERCFSRLRCRYPTNRQGHDIKMVVLKSEIAPESRLPCFREPITAFSFYYNGEYDMMKGSKEKVHYVLAAGQVVAGGTPHGDVIAVPQTNDNVFIENISDYEFEHLGYFHYDGEMYERTKHHGPGAGHPILPPCPGEVHLGFTSTPDARFTPVIWNEEASGFGSANGVSQCLLLVK